MVENSATVLKKPGASMDHLGIRFGAGYLLFFAIYGIAPYLQIMLRNLGYSPSAVGLLLGFYELIGIAGPVFLARKADESGKFNPFLLGSGFAIIAGLAILVGITTTWAAVLALSFISLGLKTPIPVLDNSLLKAFEHAKEKGNKPPTYGAIRSLGSVGFVIVLLIVQVIPGFSVSAPWVMASAMAGLTVIYLVGLAWLPETGTGPARTSRLHHRRPWLSGEFLTGLGIFALSRLSMASIGSFFSLYLVESLHWQAIGSMSALAAIAEIPMMLLAWKFLKKYSPMQAVALSSLAIIARLLLFALVPAKAGVIAGQLLHSLCYGLALPAMVSFVSLKTPPAERSVGLALLLSLGTGLPAFLGSALGGFMVEAVGYRWMFGIFSIFAAMSLMLWAVKARR